MLTFHRKQTLASGIPVALFNDSCMVSTDMIFEPMSVEVSHHKYPAAVALLNKEHSKLSSDGDSCDEQSVITVFLLLGDMSVTSVRKKWLLFYPYRSAVLNYTKEKRNDHQKKALAIAGYIQIPNQNSGKVGFEGHSDAPQQIKETFIALRLLETLRF